MAVEIKTLGNTSDGEEIRTYTLKNANGYEACVTNLGAVWMRMLVPDRTGKTEDILLGYDTPDGLMTLSGETGAVVGRNANRIREGAFSLDGKRFQLPLTDGYNNLHSGPDKFSKRMFHAEACVIDGLDAVEMRLWSPEGDQGFPGTLSVKITYLLTNENAFEIRYHLEAGDKATLANLTSHPYFNLSGHKSGDCLSQELWIDAENFCEADEHCCTTGRLLPVTGSAFDFREMKPIGRDLSADETQLRLAGGYDHNFCLLPGHDPKKPVAKARDPKSGRVLELYTDRPGVQFYAGMGLHPEITAKEGAHYHPFGGFALETQFYPNAINVPEWEQPVIRANEIQESVTAYRFGVQ